jgi:hypothetical protein
MPPTKIKVVKPKIGSENVPAFVKQLAYEISQGTLDTHLDLIYTAVDDRIRQYTSINKPNDKETEAKLALVRKYRGGDVTEPEIDKAYFVSGEKYRAVIVRFDGEPKPFENGARKARVEIMIASEASGLEAGSVKIIPLAVLMEIPKEQDSEDLDPIDRTISQKI